MASLTTGASFGAMGRPGRATAVDLQLPLEAASSSCPVEAARGGMSPLVPRSAWKLTLQHGVERAGRALHAADAADSDRRRRPKRELVARRDRHQRKAPCGHQVQEAAASNRAISSEQLDAPGPRRDRTAPHGIAFNLHDRLWRACGSGSSAAWNGLAEPRSAWLPSAVRLPRLLVLGSLPA